MKETSSDSVAQFRNESLTANIRRHFRRLYISSPPLSVTNSKPASISSQSSLTDFETLVVYSSFPKSASETYSMVLSIDLCS